MVLYLFSSQISELLFKIPYQKDWEFLLRSEQLSDTDKKQALQRNDFKIITGLTNTHMSIASSDIILAREVITYLVSYWL